MWRWSNFLHANVERSRQTLLVNMDETNVRLCQDRGRGNVSMRAYRLKQRPRGLSRSVARGATRANLTHMATICDDPEIQKLLPQFLLVNAKQVPESEGRQLRALLPARVHLLRLPKAWVSKEVMLTWLRVLRRCLEPTAETHRVVLYWDAWRAHTTASVLRVCGRYGFWPCLVPAKLTWALQPCDTHLFAMYKDRLALECQRRVVATADGKWTWSLVVESWCQVLYGVMETYDWSKAFRDNGLTPSQAHVSARVKNKLGWENDIPDVGRDLPELRHLRALFPTNAVIPIEELFCALVRRERGRPTAPAVRLETSPSPPPDPRPWFGRTRSTSALANPSAAPSASASSWLPPPPPLPPPSPPQQLPPFLPNAKRMHRRPSHRALSLPPKHPAHSGQ